MKSSVIIKGNKYGFQIVLNPTLPFEELLREVGNKFKESTHFFDLNKPIAVSFTGRELTSGEQNLLVDTISENSGLNISCVIDGAKVYETQFAKVLNEIREEEKKEKQEEEKRKEEQKKKEKKDKKDEQIEELTDRLKRQMAEFDNFRKRTEKEKAQMFEVGAKSIIEKILPVIDNFERGLASIPEEEAGSAFADGMNMIYKQLMNELEQAGVAPIEAVGEEFDPEYHNAVMQVENDELESGTVAQELQKGYMYRDSVVRHSMVQVAN